MISIEDVTVAYGGYVLLDSINFHVSETDKIGLVGKNGAGKSTILKLICGIQNPTKGHIDCPNDVTIGYLPQIMEHGRGRTVLDEAMSVFSENDEIEKELAEVTAQLETRTDYESESYLKLIERLSVLNDSLQLRLGEQPEVRARKTLLGLGFKEEDFSRLTETFSQGWNMRIELAKILLRSPQVLLLDEPLSNLDAKLRAAMRTELTKLHKRVGTTFVYVTHDQVEAMTMATRIVVMKDGLIQQVDTPQTLYDYPCNIFVAGFIGTPQMNFINGKLTKKGEDIYFEFENESLKLPAEKARQEALQEYIGKEVIAGLRPECINDDALSLEKLADSVINADVEVTELMGAEIYLYLKVGEETTLTARVSSRSTSSAGDNIKVAFDMSRIHFFDKDTERYITH